MPSLLDDPDRPWKKGAFTQVIHGQKGGRATRLSSKSAMGRSARNERYRYTEWNEGKDGVELYDHQADPHEWNNLADDPKSAGVLEEMKALLHGGWQSVRPEHP